jgi:ATP-binding cassette subfamily B protein
VSLPWFIRRKIMHQSELYPPLDLQKTVSKSRVTGLWRLMQGFRWVYISSILALAFAAVAKTGTYLLLRDFADNALEGSKVAVPLAYFALGFAGLAIFEAAFTFISGKLAARASEGVVLRLRNYLFDHLQRLSFTYHDHSKTGELIQRATSDVDAIRRFFADQGKQVGRIIMLFSINFGTLLALNTRLALYAVVFVPILIGLSFWFFKRVNARYDAYQDQDGQLSAVLQENLSGVRVVKAFARQAFEIDKFEQENLQKLQLGRRLNWMHALYWPSSDLICFSQILAIFYIGAQMTIAGTITIGTYLAFVNLIGWLIWPMRNLGRLIAQSSTGLVSYRRVADVIEEPREVVDDGRQIHFNQAGEPQLRGELVFDQVSFAYEADKPVLQNISFSAKPGQTVALLGSTGSGKTSLMNLLPRFYDYSSGNILLDGVALKDYAVHALRRVIGTVEQEPFLFSRTIRENIAYGVDRDVTEAEVEAAARAAAIHEVIQTFPDGYNTLVGEKGVTLSGGQKQRVAIARTLLKNPRILILDDSTSSVDTETEAQIRAALDNLMAGRTTFIIAHRIQTVMQADQILVLDQGRIIQHGTHQQLLHQAGMYREIYNIQAKIEEDLAQETTLVDWDFEDAEDLQDVEALT